MVLVLDRRYSRSCVKKEKKKKKPFSRKIKHRPDCCGVGITLGFFSRTSPKIVTLLEDMVKTLYLLSHSFYKVPTLIWLCSGSILGVLHFVT